jgi:hypothetical protein
LEQEAFGEKPWLVDGKNVIYPMMEPKPSIAMTDVYGSKKAAEEGEEAIRKEVDKDGTETL